MLRKWPAGMHTICIVLIPDDNGQHSGDTRPLFCEERQIFATKSILFLRLSLLQCDNHGALNQS